MFACNSCKLSNANKLIDDGHSEDAWLKKATHAWLNRKKSGRAEEVGGRWQNPSRII